MSRDLILVIDDDEEWRSYICSALGQAYPVRLASDGSSGLAIAREARPTLIILDVMMPDGMDGFTTLARLKKDERTRDIPVIMLTSVNAVTDSCYNAGHLKEYLDCEPAAFLEKPIAPDRLLAEVIRILEPGAVDEDTTPTAQHHQARPDDLENQNIS